MRVCASLSSASDLSRCSTRMVEVRLDLLGSVPAADGRDLLVTFRGPVDLGVLPDGFSGMIDIGQEPRPETSAEVVASYHDYHATPSARDIVSLLRGMDCDIAKGAFQVRSLGDLVSISKASEEVGRRHVIIGMGPLGTITRIRSGILGNEFTFGYVGEPTAPGQLSADRMEELGDDCIVTGIVGHPLSKSRSPAMHAAAFAASGLNGVYLPFDTEDLDGLEDVVRGYGIRGLNVTIPHKQAVMDHIDSVDADAAAIGAVNTITNENGRLVGSNTDIVGIGAALERASIDVDGGRVLIMGSGGSARACARYMSLHGCDTVITGRNRETGRRLASDFGAIYREPGSVSVMMYDLIVNCTPVGMYSDGPYPVSIGSIQREQAVFDMVYGKETPLIRHALAKGCRAARGEDMLAGQGAASFEAWTGRTGVFDVMRDAIDLRGQIPRVDNRDQRDAHRHRRHHRRRSRDRRRLLREERIQDGAHRERRVRGHHDGRDLRQARVRARRVRGARGMAARDVIGHPGVQGPQEQQLRVQRHTPGRAQGDRRGDGPGRPDKAGGRVRQGGARHRHRVVRRCLRMRARRARDDGQPQGRDTRPLRCGGARCGHQRPEIQDKEVHDAPRGAPCGSSPDAGGDRHRHDRSLQGDDH